MSVESSQRIMSSGLLYFLAGSIASTGINIVTSLATGHERDAGALLLLISSVGFLAAGYVLSLVGAIASDFEERKAANRLHELSTEEQVEILSELGAQRHEQVARLSLPMILSVIIALGPIVAREIIVYLQSPLLAS